MRSTDVVSYIEKAFKQREPALYELTYSTEQTSWANMQRRRTKADDKVLAGTGD